MRGILTTFLIPFACTLATVAINVILAYAGVLSADTLTGNPPVIYDVSIPLIFISTGAVTTVALVGDEGQRAAALWPALLCLFFIVMTIMLQVISTGISDPDLAGWFRVVIPDMLGLATIGVTVFQLREEGDF